VKKNLLIYLFVFFILFGCNKKDDENKNERPKVEVTYDMAFQKDETICALRFDDMKIDTLMIGSNPYISHDGKKLAYTELIDDTRHIIMYDFSTKEKVPVYISNDNNYGAVWSPNNNLLAFNVFKNYKWVTGVVNKENTLFNFITSKIKKNVYSPSWLSDSKRLVVHDLERIYIFDLDGNIIKTFFINDIIEDNSISSATCFIFTPDEKNIIYSAGIDEGFDLAEPLETLFCYNLASKKNKRIAPAGMFCADPVLGPNEQLFFSGSYNIDETLSIYKVTLSGGMPELVVSEASFPSLRIQY
jgi:Tol biopolymer transport system component